MRTSNLKTKRAPHDSPFEDVLRNVNRWRCVPLDGMGVGLFSCLCDDNLDRSVAIWLGENERKTTVEGVMKTFVNMKSAQSVSSVENLSVNRVDRVAENYHLGIKPNQQTAQNQFKPKPTSNSPTGHRSITYIQQCSYNLLSSTHTHV